MKPHIKEQLKLERKINREIELDKNGSWTAVHKIHPSDKTYNRKKHKSPSIE